MTLRARGGDDMEIICLKCGSREANKSGHVKGRQRYKCKSCGYQYTSTTPKGKPFQDKVLAVVLFLAGLSMNATAAIVGVSTKTIYMWIKDFAHKHAEMPKPLGQMRELEPEEAGCYFSEKNRRQGGGGKLLVLNLGRFADESSVDIVIHKRNKTTIG